MLKKNYDFNKQRGLENKLNCISKPSMTLLLDKKKHFNTKYEKEKLQARSFKETLETQASRYPCTQVIRCLSLKREEKKSQKERYQHRMVMFHVKSAHKWKKVQALQKIPLGCKMLPMQNKIHTL